MLFLDLDDFKVVNDGFGHEAGDRLLIQVAQRLRGAVREQDLVARLGGDEFTVLCPASTTRRWPRSPPAACAPRSSQPFDVAGQRRHVRVSIGARVAAPGEADPEALLRDADSAMYQAKEAGKDRVELFSDATRARILRRIELETQLRIALESETLGGALPAAAGPRQRPAGRRRGARALERGLAGRVHPAWPRRPG